MLPIYLILAALLIAPSATRAQEQDTAAPQEAIERSEPAPQPAVRQAVPRGSRSQGDNPRVGTATPRLARPSPPPAPAPVFASPSAAQPQDAAPQEASQQSEPAPEPAARQAVPRGSRSQGDNPRRGTAVPRRAAPPPPSPSPPRTDRGRVPNRGRTVVVRPPSVYNYYYPPSYYYPRRYYPYGYGSFGLGYFYYDPYRWSPGYAYGSGYYQRPFSTFDIGELRLDVSPRYAQVYVDGYYAGVVDDYDGAFQALKLESGAYRIDIMMPGYETLTFDVRINPGQKIRYRGELQRRP